MLGPERDIVGFYAGWGGSGVVGELVLGGLGFLGIDGAIIWGVVTLGIERGAAELAVHF